MVRSGKMILRKFVDEEDRELIYPASYEEYVQLEKSVHMEKVLCHGKHGDYYAFRRKGTDKVKGENNKRVHIGDELVSYAVSPSGKKISCRKLEKLGDSLEEFKKNNFISSVTKNANGKLVGNFTSDYFQQDGSYTKEREQLHDSIVQKIVQSADKPPYGFKPVAFLYGGGSASGKSSVINKIVKPQIEEMGMRFGVVDADAIKGELPEYKHLIGEDSTTAAFRVHEESSDISKKALDALIADGRNFCYDGTMKNFKKYDQLIDTLKAKGYDIILVGADVPTSVAIQRSDMRAKHTGRKVPHDIIKGSHRGFADAFPRLIGKADRYYLFDNSGESGQEKPIITSNGTEEYINPQLWERFKEKSKEK